jgi:ElaB/YqjD/DUF883 family membrane-anchored ribosome-binding protein
MSVYENRTGYEKTLELETETDEELARTRHEAMLAAEQLEDAPVSDEVAATRAQIEETRAHLTETVDEIKDRLSPSHLMEEAKESVIEATSATVEQVKEVVSSVAHTVSETAHNVADSARDAAHSTSEAVRPALTKAQRQGEKIVDAIRMNPVPAAIAGFGLAWLLFSIRKQEEAGEARSNDFNGGNSFDQRKNPTGFGYEPLELPSEASYNGPSTTDRLKDSLHNAGEAVSNAAHAAQDKMSNAAHSAQEKVSDVAHAAQEKVSNFATATRDKASDLASTAKDKASDFADAAKDKAQATYGTVDDFVHENPLAAGAVALLVGAAVGLALPATRKENEWMGDTRDRLKDKATDALSDVSHKVQNVAQAALGTAKESFQEVKSQVTDTVKSEAQTQGLTA